MQSRNSTSFFAKIIDVYLYNELYKRGLIKSKSFNFSSSLECVRSKVMFTLKSMVTATIKEKDLSEVFTSVRFSKSNFMIDWHLNRYTLDGKICIGFARGYIENAQCGFASIGDNRMDFQFRDIYSIYGNSNHVINCKEKVNEVINDVLFTQSAICEIGAFVKEMRSHDEDELTRFKYLSHCINGIFYDGPRELCRQRTQSLREHPEAETIFNKKVTLTNNTIDNLTKDVEKFINDNYAEYCTTPEPTIAEEEIGDDDRFIIVAGQRVRLNDE